MATAKNMKELAKEIEKLAAKAMQNGTNVKTTVIKEGQNQVQKVVYDVYDPVAYQRSGDLKAYWDTENTSDGIAVFNDRPDDPETGNDVVETVITGKGYQYDFEYNGVPRDFIQATKDELNDDKRLSDALSKDLNSLGIKTK